MVVAELAAAFTQQTGLRTPRTATASRRQAGVGRPGGAPATHHFCGDTGVPRERVPHYRRIFAMSWSKCSYQDVI